MVEEERGNGFLHIFSESFPIVGLGENRFAQTFGDESAVGLLAHLEDDFIHGFRVCHSG